VHFQQKTDTFSILFAILQKSRAHSQLLFELSQCLKVKAGALHKKNHVFLLHLAPLEGLVHNGEKKKKKVRERAPPQGAHVLASATTR
jgi:hypothetical protein